MTLEALFTVISLEDLERFRWKYRSPRKSLVGYICIEIRKHNTILRIIFALTTNVRRDVAPCAVSARS